MSYQMNFKEAGKLRPVRASVADEDVEVLVNAGVVGDTELAPFHLDTLLNLQPR